MLDFAEQVPKLQRRKIKTLQVNVGKLCNLQCRHCHVGSGPKKLRENMSLETARHLMRLIRSSPELEVVDFTGGAPELNPHFRDLVHEAHAAGKEVWDRCNLTVIFEPGQKDLLSFFVDHQVHVIASLPCYSEKNVEYQRGDGVFAKSIEAIQSLNRLGYGKPGSPLLLDLVYNPVGAVLPPDQATLQADYKKKLKEDFDIVFNKLYTITNMPIKRFLVDLKQQGKDQSYMELLAEHFNHAAIERLMCRDMISVSWDGFIYDCDFNQALDLKCSEGPRHISGLTNIDVLSFTSIVTKNHCYGCTAGAGSSCGGAIIR